MENDLYEYLDKHLSLIPKTKDHCAGCEHLEVLHMLIPRIEELEKSISRMMDTSDNDFDRLNLAINTIMDQERRIKELEKRVEELEKIYEKYER